MTVDARLTPFVGTQFVYPTDWTTVDGTHLAPTPMAATFATIPAGGEEIAKFSISAAQVGILHSNAWHPCVVVSVNADNDYAFASAAFVSNPVVTRIGNLAQRNLSLINVLADTASAAAFPFLAGNALNTDRFLELVINRTALPKASSLLLALDRANDFFPYVDVDAHVPDGGGGGGHDGCGGGLVFLDRTRVRTRFGCCEGVLTLEKGSRFDCGDKRRVRDVSVTGGDVVVRDGQRYALITDDIAVVRLEKAAGQLLPLVLEARLPGGLQAGRQLEVSVAQRDESHQVVGGASVLLVTG